MLKPAYSSLQPSVPSILISYIAQEVNFGHGDQLAHRGPSQL